MIQNGYKVCIQCSEHFPLVLKLRFENALVRKAPALRVLKTGAFVMGI
ncbi:Uncharacterized protein dnm_086810 [Desulfonema magnum]|uniref:Uncharacterized protein n=1 Tax=Desulfonema magnum TaxID=45655 RepID=A0A975BVN1_9BACT|nr:Uncharacterized protein dnm_086810 [Desulfonema magnum]